MGSTEGKLLNLLAEHSYRFDPENKLRLVSGKLSEYYLRNFNTLEVKHQPSGVFAENVGNSAFRKST